MITEINSVEQFRQAITQEVSIIEYHASWSGPCKAISPTFTQLSDTYSKLKFYRLDVDECAQLTQDAGARMYPTFIVYSRGQKVCPHLFTSLTPIPPSTLFTLYSLFFIS
ncbi:Cytoplasmic thioredoxin isoenzyme 2 [Serendipita sp. 405]|nr:Cytoplasmic thioredoxin isoenzyme 2 [Serendipita sp. 405]